MVCFETIIIQKKQKKRHCDFILTFESWNSAFSSHKKQATINLLVNNNYSRVQGDASQEDTLAAHRSTPKNASENSPADTDSWYEIVRDCSLISFVGKPCSNIIYHNSLHCTESYAALNSVNCLILCLWVVLPELVEGLWQGEHFIRSLVPFYRPARKSHYGIYQKRYFCTGFSLWNRTRDRTLHAESTRFLPR